MIEIYSRHIVGVRVQAHESGLFSQEMLEQAFGIHGTPHVVHVDRDASMTSKTVATLLADLHVTRPHSRPKVPNDNPYSEAWFKTLKYAPVFPERFGSLYDARAFMNEFVEYYKHEHLHTGSAENTTEQRSEILAAVKSGQSRTIQNPINYAQNPGPASARLDRQIKRRNRKGDRLLTSSQLSHTP